MDKETGTWLCRRNGTAEILNEGDGNWLLRSAWNRDRVLRFSRSEMEEVMLMVASPGGNVAAPECVSRRC